MNKKQEFEPTMIITNTYVVCYWCEGSGVEDSLVGPVTCSECKGNCVIRDRDEKGRFRTQKELWIHEGDGQYSFKEII